ncbi:MAG: insulinase family protein [Gemmatimonadota bacterium]|nr:insulinase family protein [Gemmatimonadota bacterium]
MLLSVALALSTITSSFDVSGVKVILRQISGNDVVAANLYLLGGTRQSTPATSGIEPFLLNVSERGTQRYPRERLRRTMAQLGTEIVVQPSYDWTVFGIRSTREVFDSTWSIFADRLSRPTLAKSEITLVRNQFLSAVRQRRDDPDASVEFLADSIAFVGHPYSIPVGGTEASISAFDSATLRNYSRSQMVTSRMLLVVVGDIDRAHVERLVRETLGTLPRGDYQWTLPTRVPELPTALAVERRSLPTNYILGYYSGPLADSRDYQTLRIATSVLTGRMFAEIRTRQNLTYDVHAPFLDRAATAGGLYVSTAFPDTTLRLMRAAISDLETGLLDRTGLGQLEQQFITEYFLDNETNAAQADFIARAQLYQGDFRAADRFVADLKKVTPEDVQRVVRTYMKGLRFAYVGDPSKLKPGTIALF